MALGLGQVYRRCRHRVRASDPPSGKFSTLAPVDLHPDGQYINEQAPARIRGFLLVAYSLWFSLGGLMASIGLKAQADKHPLNWKTPIYTQYAMLGLSLLIFAFLPESPCKHPVSPTGETH